MRHQLQLLQPARREAAFVHPVRKQEGTPTEGKKLEHGLRFHTQGWWKLNGPSGHGVLLHWDSLEMAAYKRSQSAEKTEQP